MNYKYTILFFCVLSIFIIYLFLNNTNHNTNDTNIDNTNYINIRKAKFGNIDNIDSIDNIDILQKDFSGSSNVYKPYIYYDYSKHTKPNLTLPNIFDIDDYFYQG